MNFLPGILANMGKIDQGIDPSTQGILSAGLGMLAASGPSRTPTSLGQILGQGGMQGLNEYQQARMQREQELQARMKLKLLSDQQEESRRVHDSQIKRYDADALKDTQASELARKQNEYFSDPRVRQLVVEGKVQEALAGMPGLSGTHLTSLASTLKPKQATPSQLSQLITERDALPSTNAQVKAIYDNAIRKESETARQISPPQVTVNQPAPVTPVTLQDPDDPNGTIIVDGRTGAKIGKGPKLTEAGKMDVKRQFGMEGLGQSIQEAEDILGGIRRDPETGSPLPADKPTGSGIGTAWDVAAGFVGMNPQGSVEAQRLKAIAGALTSKMPRMEGPQSDRDTQLYKEMAAQVGDSMLPTERRKAALGEVKKLWSKYEKGGSAKPAMSIREQADAILRGK